MNQYFFFVNFFVSCLSTFFETKFVEYICGKKAIAIGNLKINNLLSLRLLRR